MGTEIGTMSKRALPLVIFVALFLMRVALGAIAPNPTKLLPESAILSETRYSNVFLGFSLPLPESRAVRKVRQPLPDHGHALLALDFTNQGMTTALRMFAFRKGDQYSTADQAAKRWHDEEQAAGASLEGPKRKKGRNLPLVVAESRQILSGAHTKLWVFEVRDYVVLAVAQSVDTAFLSKLDQTFESISLSDVEPEMAQNGDPYQGPSLPRATVDDWLAHPPSTQIDKGNLADHVYSNAQLGLSFRIPAGWKVGRAIHEETSEGRSPLLFVVSAQNGLVHRVSAACSKALFAAEDSGGAKTVSMQVIAADCLPDVEFPASVSSDGAADFATSVAIVVSNFARVSKAGMFTIGNQPVLSLRTNGVPLPAGSDRLVPRNAEQVFVLKRGKYYVLLHVIASNRREIGKIIQTGLAFTK